MKHLLHVFFLLVLSVAAVNAVTADDASYEQTQEYVIQVASQDETFLGYLDTYEEWYADAWDTGEGIWEIHFNNGAEEEWLGYAIVDATQGTVLEAFAARPASPADIAAVSPLIDTYLRDDDEVRVIMGNNPDAWSFWIDFNRYEQHWEVYLERGLETWVAVFSYENGDLTLQELYNYDELNEQQAVQYSRDTAISLAFQAEGIETLWEYDYWTTYVSQQGSTTWAVEFVANSHVIFYVLVDVDNRLILEAYAG